LIKRLVYLLIFKDQSASLINTVSISMQAKRLFC